MTTRALVLALVSCASFAFAAGCAADTEEPGDEELSAESDLTSTLRIAANGSASVRLNARTAGDVALTIDCSPPANPDDVGPVVKVSGATLCVGAGEIPRAGFWHRALAVPVGNHSLTVTSVGGAAVCRVRTAPVAAGQTCRAWSAWRSPNPDHNHLRVGSEAIQAGWEPFPASGNHWGAWAPWAKVYDKPVKTGYVLHNLEHGGLVLSYKCSSPNESAACKSASDELVALANTLGTRRLYVTPDPTQPAMFAIRGWRMAYTAECLDTQSAGSFAKAAFNHGREDIDADPPIPFDPSTLNVPCQDLMAAPDSCN
jgi:Protein of unknown function (DUF3105)